MKIDPALEKYYSEGKEKDRLKRAKLEKDRTLHILKKKLPAAPSVLLDIGGGPGVYASLLTEQGYQVHLLDPIALHIEEAKAGATKLASITQGDARILPFASESVDAALLLGPLYHIVDLEERRKALREAYRVLKPGGQLFAAGISRFASLMDYMHKGVIFEGLKFAQVKEDLLTGVHRKSSDPNFVFGLFHRPKDLEKEVQAAGFVQTSLCAIEGPVWASSLIEPLTQDLENWSKLIALLDLVEEEESIIGASSHFMVIGLK